MTEDLGRDEWLATWKVYSADFHDDEVLDGTCSACFGEYGDGWSNCTCYDDYNLSYYEEPRDPYLITVPERLSLVLYNTRHFLSRIWRRCPDCDRLELVLWQRVGEHWGCIPV
jgi:hypothetical protein